MGRGGNDKAAQQGVSRPRGEALSGAVLFNAPVSVSTRSLKREFEPDRNSWAEREREFMSKVVGELEQAALHFAATDEGWKAYLRFYAETPHYSAFNNLWARTQLRHNGVEPDGLLLSESQWRRLGRRVKAEYARPEARRDKRFGYDRNRDWDPRYAAEMMRPLGLITIKYKLKDADGNPILDENGEPKYELRRIWRDGQPRYSSFLVYHEDATEDLDGGPAKPLPSPPWADATGSEEDAERLLEDLRRRVLPGYGLKLELAGEGFEGQGRSARVEGSRVIVDASRPKAEQAVAVLGVACERAGGEIRPGAGEDADDARKRARAAAESAKYVISSRYGLDSAEQTFTAVAEVARKEGGLRNLTTDIHRRVTTLMHALDPRMRLIAEGNEKARAEARARRAARRQAERDRRRGDRAANPFVELV